MAIGHVAIGLFVGPRLSMINGLKCYCLVDESHFVCLVLRAILTKGAIHGQPTDGCGTVKNSPDVLVGPKVSM